MDIKDLNKTQLILLTLLITFVVSIATGIVTVSLMQQMPKSVPQTINNVIQRTIERVTTISAPISKNTENSSTDTKEATAIFGDGDALVSIYPADEVTKSTMSTEVTSPEISTTVPEKIKALGQGIIISDIGLILVDSSILTDGVEIFKVILNKTDFNATILKKFANGFTILKISQKKIPEVTVPTPPTDTTILPKIDIKP